MLITKLLSEYPNFFSLGDYKPVSEVKLGFAGFAKKDINAKIERDSLIVSANNSEQGEKSYQVLLGRNVSVDDLSLTYSHGLLSVKLKPRQEENKKITID